jgi:hypothetical protein
MRFARGIILMRYALLLIAAALLSPIWAQNPCKPGPSTLPRQILTNDGIITLAQAGYDEDFIIDMIMVRQTRFDAGVEGLAKLAECGLSERLVRYVVQYEHKSSGIPLPAVPATPVVVRARVVNQKVLVPESSVPIGNPVFAAPPPTTLVPAPGPMLTAGPLVPVSMATPTVAFPPGYPSGTVFVSHGWFYDRWYISTPFPMVNSWLPAGAGYPLSLAHWPYR